MKSEYSSMCFVLKQFLPSTWRSVPRINATESQERFFEVSGPQGYT